MKNNNPVVGCVGVLLLCGIVVFAAKSCGVGGWGPTTSVVGTVQSKHMDAGKESSHYMVTVDGQTFEVDNGLLLGVWSADTIYGKLIVGKRYRITAKGNRYENMLMQEYPYIISAEEQP